MKLPVITAGPKEGSSADATDDDTSQSQVAWLVHAYLGTYDKTCSRAAGSAEGPFAAKDRKAVASPVTPDPRYSGRDAGFPESPHGL